MPISGIGGGSSSGGSSDVRAGGAFVEIYGKDKLTKQLDGLKSSAKSQVMGLSKLVGGFALLDIAKTGAEAAIGMNRFNASMEEGERITARLEEAQSQLRDRIFEKVGGKMKLPVEIIPEGLERVNFLEKQLEQAQKNLAITGQNADKANEKVKSLAGGANLFIEKLPFAGSGLEVDRAEAKGQADELNKRRDALRGLTEALREQIAAQKAKGPRFEWLGSFEEMEKSLKTQYETLGMTADEALLYKMQIEGAAKGVKGLDHTLEQARDRMKMIADKGALLKAKEAFKSFDAELEFRVKTAGMTPEQIQLERLKEQHKSWLDAAGNGAEGMARREGLMGLAKHLENLAAAKDEKTIDVRLERSVAGMFGGDTRSFGTVGQFRRDELPAKVDESNTWLGRIFGAVSVNDKPAVLPNMKPPPPEAPKLSAPSLVAPALPKLEVPNLIPQQPNGREMRINMPTVKAGQDVKQLEDLNRTGKEQLTVLKQIQSGGPLTFR
ncbi:MAG: hypothetical protein U0791_26545 [Gemmataceae bacterium]